MSEIHGQTPLTATPGPRVERYAPPGAWIIFAAVTLAVAFVTLNAIFQFGIASAFPLLAILVIALDVVILYYLTAGWSRSA
jgi:hypothetical protein